MSYTSRIKQAEKHAGKGDGTVHIEIERCFDRDIEDEYAVHRARQILGIRSTDGRTETIYVIGPEIDAKYQDMTSEQAKAIMNGK